MTSETGIILTRLREKRGLSQQDVADALDTTQSIVSRHERGSAVVGRNWLERYADYYGVSMDELSGRRETTAEIMPPMLNEIAYDPTVKLPVLGRIRAGMPVIVQEEIIDWQEMPADSVRGGDYFLLEVTGDSMIEAHMPPGSRVLVRRQSQVDQGDIAVVIVNGNEATVKRLRFENGEVTLIPANARMTETRYDARDVRVIGKVVQTIIRYE